MCGAEKTPRPTVRTWLASTGLFSRYARGAGTPVFISPSFKAVRPTSACKEPLVTSGAATCTHF